MTHKEFGKILADRIEKTITVLNKKAAEYSTSDRLHAFKAAGRVLNVTPENALLGMFVKHFVSILDIVDSDSPVDNSVIDEKLGDAINYLILLEALLKEKK